jgi:hypothetical protein
MPIPSKEDPTPTPAERHVGPDAMAWLHPQPDGSTTLYAIRPGFPTLIVTGLHLHPAPAPSVPPAPQTAAGVPNPTH